MSNFLEGDISTADATIHYYRTGNRSGPAVVLVHGFGDSGRCWPRVVAALAADYDLILVDTRGHGRSSRFSAPAPEEKTPDDLAHLIRTLDLAESVVIGHSMGAMSAAHLAARYPDLPGGIVLEDPAWFLPEPADTQTEETDAEEEQSLEQWLTDIQAKSLEQTLADCRAEHPQWDEAEFQPWAESKHQFDLGRFRYSMPDRDPWEEFIPRITCPALLITADVAAGAITSPEVAAGVDALWPNGRTIHIPGAGHSIRRDQFEAYLAAVKAFLDAVTRH